MQYKTSTALALGSALLAGLPFLGLSNPGPASMEPVVAATPTEDHPLSWLAGHWVGEGLGGYAEEVWTAPRGGVMVGMFRAMKQDRTNFYELVTIQKGREGWEMRLRHFHPDLVAWEEKGEPLVWPLTFSDETSAAFGPVTYEWNGANKLDVFVELDGGDEPAKLVFERVTGIKKKTAEGGGAR